MKKVFLSLQKARVELQKANLKKSGANKFAGYRYFELSDILPTINELMLKHNLFSFIQFNESVATLTIVSTEDDSEVIFTSPMSTANLKGCHDVQNLGAVQSYLRRYLYMNAFEIVEADVLDATTGAEEKKPGRGTKTLSDAQVNRLIAIGKSKGVSIDKIKAVASKDYGTTELAKLTKANYDALCDRLEGIKWGGI